MDFLKASSVAQDILFAKNKVQDSEEEQPAPQESKLDDFLEEAAPLPQEPEIAEEFEQEPTLDVTPEPVSRYDFDEQEEEEDEDDQDDLLARAMSNLRESPEEASEEEQLEQDFDFESFKQAVDELHEETESEPATEEPPAEEELLGQDFDFESLKQTLAEPPEDDAEPVVEETKPVVVEKKVTEKTFEEFSIFESVPENLLDAHICMEQEPLPEEMVGVHDLLAVVPDALLNQFEVEPQIGTEKFVQTEDAAITLRKKAKK